MLAGRKDRLKELVSRQRAELALLRNNPFYESDWQDFIFKLPKKKLSTASMRAQFVVFLYEYIKEYSTVKKECALQGNKLNDKLIEKLGVLSELIIDVQYYENYIIDGKNGANNQEMLVEYLNAASNLKSMVYNYAQSIFPNDLETSAKVRNTVQTIFNLVSYGQHIEQKYNHFNTYKKGLKKIPNLGDGVEPLLDKSVIKEIKSLIERKTPKTLSESELNFLITYVKRIYLTSGILFQEFGKLIIDLSGFKVAAHSEVLKKFSAQFGIMLQLVNDNIDIISQKTGSKRSEDAFSDLINKNITLPIFLVLREGVKKSKPLLNILEAHNENSYLTYFEEKINNNTVLVRMAKVKNQRAIQQCMVPIIQDICMPIGREIVKISNLDTSLAATNLLIDMSGIAEKNRFYEDIAQLYEVLKPQEKKSKQGLANELIQKALTWPIEYFASLRIQFETIIK